MLLSVESTRGTPGCGCCAAVEHSPRYSEVEDLIPTGIGDFFILSSFFLSFPYDFSFIVKSKSVFNQVPQKEVHLFKMTRKDEKSL